MTDDPQIPEAPKTITPAQAREWLNATSPKRQRKVNDAYVQWLADAMLAGSFESREETSGDA